MFFITNSYDREKSVELDRNSFATQSLKQAMTFGFRFKVKFFYIIQFHCAFSRKEDMIWNKITHVLFATSKDGVTLHFYNSIWSKTIISCNS